MHLQSAPSVALIDADAPVCPKHDLSMHLRRHGKGDRLTWRCPACGRSASKASLERKRQRRRKRLSARLLRSDAEDVRLHLMALVRAWGGMKQLIAHFQEGWRAGLLLKLMLAHDELLAKAEEAQRRENALVHASARDPVVISTAARLLAELSPRELRPVLERLMLRSRDRRACVMHGLGEGI